MNLAWSSGGQSFIDSQLKKESNLTRIYPGALEATPLLIPNQQTIKFDTNLAWSSGGHSFIDSQLKKQHNLI